MRLLFKTYFCSSFVKRFPNDFMFQLNKEESEILRSQFVTSKFSRGGRKYLPFCFTENGVAMLSSVLNSEKSILKHDIKLKQNDQQFQVIFEAIKQIMLLPEKSNKIGFLKDK